MQEEGEQGVGEKAIKIDPTIFFFFLLFRATPWHMEIPRLGVESELQLLAYLKAAPQQRQDLQPIPQLIAVPDLQPTE